ncbi:hypothetical protein TWF694_001404 [Orbilia ellipsospora]|uniref:Isotrichodermin C-15 hydroxylase n=1 Tax=Orbilia ellipsospora TaxID=2528407 RepID=A0AAV9XRP6_9PEZI
MHLKYGPVVRIAPDELSFADPTAFKEIYGHQVGKSAGRLEFTKDPHFYQVVKIQPPSILSAEKDLHSLLRRSLAPGFSDRSLRQQEGIISGHIDKLMQRLREKSSSGQPLDMADWFSWVTLDIIGDLALGEPLGCVETGTKEGTWGRYVFVSPFANALLVGFRYLNVGFLAIPVLVWVVVNITKKAKMLQNALGRRLNSEERPDLVEGLMQKQRAGGIDAGVVETTSATVLVAGTETTATLLSGMTYLLLMNPDALERVTWEVRTSFKSEEEIDLISTQRLEYMLACLSEALRIYPPVSPGLPRIVPKGGAQICGEMVPEGTILSVGHYAVYHHPDYWTAPSEFHPERFLGDSKFANDKLEALQPFSIGPRDCIGRNLAYAEMRLILARILFSFDMRIAPESVGWLDGQKAYTFWEKPDLNVYLSLRCK